MLGAVLVFAAVVVQAPAATLTLEWDPSPPETQATEYRIYQATAGEPLSLAATVPATTNRANLNLEPGEYRFVARSANMWGESIDSNEVKTPPRPTPPNLKPPKLMTVIIHEGESHFELTIAAR